MHVRTAAAFSSVLLLTAHLACTSGQAAAQSADPKGGDPAKTAGEGAPAAPKKLDEMAEAAKLLKGAAGSPECVWVGRRIISLLWRDDLDTAARHREVYERFGCPNGHIQVSFRCLVRQGDLDPKAPESLNERSHSCWINPELDPQTAAAAAKAAAASKDAAATQQ